jgi:hypothetical protein
VKVRTLLPVATSQSRSVPSAVAQTQWRAM